MHGGAKAFEKVACIDCRFFKIRFNVKAIAIYLCPGRQTAWSPRMQEFYFLPSSSCFFAIFTITRRDTHSLIAQKSWHTHACLFALLFWNWDGYYRVSKCLCNASYDAARVFLRHFFFFAQFYMNLSSTPSIHSLKKLGLYFLSLARNFFRFILKSRCASIVIF